MYDNIYHSSLSHVLTNDLGPCRHFFFFCKTVVNLDYVCVQVHTMCSVWLVQPPGFSSTSSLWVDPYSLKQTTLNFAWGLVGDLCTLSKETSCSVALSLDPKPRDRDLKWLYCIVKWSGCTIISLSLWERGSSYSR